MEWPQYSLGKVLSLEYGKPLPARERDTNGDYQVAGSNGPAGTHAQAIVEGPGVVVGRKGSAGKVYWYEGAFWPIDTTYFVVPRLPLDMRWAYYLLGTLRLELLASTTGVPGLNRNDAYRLQIALPAISEQRRIVEILDQADGLRRLCPEADVRTNRVLPALYSDFFLNQASPWPSEPLGKHLRRGKGSLQSGPFGSQLHNSDFVKNGPVRVVGIDNVLDGEFAEGRNRRISASKYEQLKKFTLEPGDVLVTIMGTVGRCCVFPSLPEPAICTKHVYRIQLAESIEPEYLSASLRYSSIVRAQLGASITGQIVAGVTSTDLRRLQLSIPPRDLQARFAEIAIDLRRGADVVRKRNARVDDLFCALLQRAFSGSLTAPWREAHMKELLQEMEQQANALAAV